MAAITDAIVAADLLCRLEKLTAAQLGSTVLEARACLSGKLGASRHTLTNIRKQRRKTVPSWLMSAIRGALLEAINVEIRKCQGELEIARRLGAHPDAPEIRAVETAISDARAILGGENAARRGRR
jgi:hypothetical protein